MYNEDNRTEKRNHLQKITAKSIAGSKEQRKLKERTGKISEGGSYGKNSSDRNTELQ